jgi:quercetin dioxygenase-like cupin family protein
MGMPVVDYAALPAFSMRPGILGKWIAGLERGSSTLSVLLNVVEPNARVPRHYHNYEEVILVEEGEVWLTLEAEQHRLAPGQVAIVPPNTVHAWGNAGPGTARVVFIWPVLEPFAPGNSTYVEGAPPQVS